MSIRRIRIRRGGDRDKEGAMIYGAVTFCLLADAIGTQV